MKQRVIAYSDELNDEFSPTVLPPVHIGDDYEYIKRTAFKRFTAFFWYYIFAMPLAFIYTRGRFGVRVVGKEKLRAVDGGYFLYGNHTQPIADAFIPHTFDIKRRKHTVVHSGNLRAPVLGRITPSLGALPLPDTLRAAHNFNRAIESVISEGRAVIIYPEAHIWPYYTDIRDFSDKSFSYPARLCTPVFCFTNVYKRGVLGARIITYIDGPFYPDKSLSLPERRRALRDQVFCAMKKQAEKSDFEKIRYIKKEDSK